MGSAGPVAAQPSSATDNPASGEDSEIVVTASPTPTNERHEVASFAKQVLRKTERGTPVGRFFLPVCAVTVGLPEEFAAPLLERVRANAKAAGLAVNKNPSCKANLHVIFVNQTEKFYDAKFWNEAPALRHLNTPQRNRVIEQNGPVKAWNNSQNRNSSGLPITLGSTQPIPVAGGRIPTNLQYGNSRLKTAISSEITNAYVAFDLAEAQGKTIQQLADYVTMRTLAPTSAVQGTGAADTILTLFDEPTPPTTITQFDRALLNSLYSAGLTIKPRTLFGRIGSATINIETDE
jgi:hypothetical protein